MSRHGAVRSLLLASALLLATPWAAAAERSIEVVATAYNSKPDQTGSQPRVAAWGDPLEPGMKVIAVSRDLIPMGLRHRRRVRIEGLPGEYVVLDKMAARWKRRIDIYLGDDVGAARRWGVRRVRIRWKSETSP